MWFVFVTLEGFNLPVMFQKSIIFLSGNFPLGGDIFLELWTMAFDGWSMQLGDGYQHSCSLWGEKERVWRACVFSSRVGFMMDDDRHVGDYVQ